MTVSCYGPRSAECIISITTSPCLSKPIHFHCVKDDSSPQATLTQLAPGGTNSRLSLGFYNIQTVPCVHSPSFSFHFSLFLSASISLQLPLNLSTFSHSPVLALSPISLSLSISPSLFLSSSPTLPVLSFSLSL